MTEYLHGAYGRTQIAENKVAQKSRSAIIYIGTAPVHTLEGGAANVNKPILVNSMAEAKRLFGYSGTWADYTLCEAMKVHLDIKGVGPLVLINVLDPVKHKKATGGTATKKPENGRIVLTGAGSTILDSVVVKTTDTPAVTKIKGTDYAISYDSARGNITITELSAGALGTDNLEITWNEIDPSALTNQDVIGATDGEGLNTGIFAVKNVYQETGYIPSYILAPGFSSVPAIHDAMVANSKKINGHWDAYLFTDIPIVEGSTAITLTSAKTWKDTNAYVQENETPNFPIIESVDGNKYHLSVLRAANFQELLIEEEGIPYKTASNTPCPIIKNLYLGANLTGRVYDDELINEKLVKNGIASAAFVGGEWALWGAHSGAYSQENADMVNVSETNRMMLYYISNDFQHRRPRNTDKPLSANDIKTIAAEEQARLDALVKMGALTYGEVSINTDEIAHSDMVNGDYSFTFKITTTPLAKSLTALVYWTPEGFTTYFADFN